VILWLHQNIISYHYFFVILSLYLFLLLDSFYHSISTALKLSYDLSSYALLYKIVWWGIICHCSAGYWSTSVLFLTVWVIKLSNALIFCWFMKVSYMEIRWDLNEAFATIDCNKLSMWEFLHVANLWLATNQTIH
jgi:hypothetical protein